MATVANQAIFGAALEWVNLFAAHRDRATLIGFGALLVAIESALLGAVLGALAHHGDAIWPVVIVLTLNLCAAAAAARAPTRQVNHQNWPRRRRPPAAHM